MAMAVVLASKATVVALASRVMAVVLGAATADLRAGEALQGGEVTASIIFNKEVLVVLQDKESFIRGREILATTMERLLAISMPAPALAMEAMDSLAKTMAAGIVSVVRFSPTMVAEGSTVVVSTRAGVVAAPRSCQGTLVTWGSCRQTQ